MALAVTTATLPNAFLNALAPAAYWLLTALFNVFPLPRLRGFRSAFAHAGDAMDRGYSVLIFPEGTRSPDGEMKEFFQGRQILCAPGPLGFDERFANGRVQVGLAPARILRSQRGQ